MRYYDVALARWVEIDPADEFHTPYSYVGGDPVNLIDPNGAQTENAAREVFGPQTEMEARALEHRQEKMTVPGSDANLAQIQQNANNASFYLDGATVILGLGTAVYPP